MTNLEIKTEIQKVIDSVPENTLQDIPDFLKVLQVKSEDKIKLANNLKKILTEEKKLLQKLA